MQSDMTEPKTTDEATALKFIFEKSWPAIGDEFFRLLVRHLAGALRVRYVYITECTDMTRTRVRTLASWMGEDFGENIEYDLSGTPCENVMKGNISYYPKDVQALFPRDEYFVTLGVQSYLGIPFFDTSNKLIGHMGILDTKPMNNDIQEMSIFKIFATRAGIELERKQAEKELKKYRDHLEELVDQRTRMLKATNEQLQQEITERKKAEEELQSINEQLDSVIFNMPIGVAILDGPEFKYAKINRTLADINGLSVEDHIGRPLAEVIPQASEDIIPRLRKVWKSNKTSPQHEFSTRLPKDPDRGKYFIDCFFPIEGKDGKVKAIGTAVLDITNRKESELILKESHDLLECRVVERTKELKLFKSLINQSNDAIFVIDPETGRFLDVNNKVSENLGYSRKELLKMKAKDIGVTIYDNQSWQKLVKKICQNDSKFIQGEQRRKDGTIFPVEINSKIIKEADNEYLVVVARDMTERMKIEEDLKNSEKRRRGWLESSPVCTKIVDLDFNLQYMSAAGVKGLKIENVKEYYGKPFPFNFYSDSVKNAITRNLKKVKKTGESVKQETPAFDTKGNKLCFYSTFVPVNGNDGRIDYIMVVSSDITERKQAEEALKSSKLNLERKNIALNEIVAQIEIEKNKIKENITANVDQVLMPSLKNLKRKGTRLDRGHIDVMEKNLKELSSTFGKKISEKEWNLTPKEIKICDLIRKGLSNKEIASLFNTSLRTIESHRNNIRKKFSISGKAINLTTYLQFF